MPAYDFKEVFMDDKEKNGVLVMPGEAISEKLIQNLTVSDKNNIFGTIDNQPAAIDNNLDLSEIGYTKNVDKQMEIRSKLTLEFLSYLKTYTENNKSFNMSRSQFQFFMIFPAAITVLLSLFISGGLLVVATLLFPIYIYLQASDSAQMKIFESKIWKAIDAIPEDKLKAVLHSILSNKFNTDYSYSDDEIKEIIYNYMYNSDKVSKVQAQLEIRDRLRFLIKQSNKIINKTDK